MIFRLILYARCHTRRKTTPWQGSRLMINWQVGQTIQNLDSFNASNLPVWTLWLRLQSTAHRRKITSQISQSLVAKWPFCIDPADSLGGEYTNQKGFCKERGVQRSTWSLAYLAGRQTWPWHYFRSCSTTCHASAWWQGNSSLGSSRKEIRWLEYGGKLAKHLCILIVVVGRGSQGISGQQLHLTQIYARVCQCRLRYLTSIPQCYCSW